MKQRRESLTSFACDEVYEGFYCFPFALQRIKRISTTNNTTGSLTLMDALHLYSNNHNCESVVEFIHCLLLRGLLHMYMNKSIILRWVLLKLDFS